MFLFIALLLWIIIAARSSCIRNGHRDRYATVYKDVLFSDEMLPDDDDKEGMIGPLNLYMKDSDIWSHAHRMYFIGENSVNYPWFLTKDFPSNGLTE